MKMREIKFTKYYFFLIFFLAQAKYEIFSSDPNQRVSLDVGMKDRNEIFLRIRR